MNGKNEFPLARTVDSGDGNGNQILAYPPRPERRGTGFLQSFGHAFRGLLHTVVHQRNMRVHLLCAILVGLVGSGIPLGLAEKVTLIFCVLLIFFAEIMNSAMEQIVDLAIQQFDEKARIAKDAAAAGVLVLALGTVAIFAAILAYNWSTVVGHGADVMRQVLVGVPLSICAWVLMSEARKSAFVDHVLAAVCLLLFVASAMRSTSYVYSALTFGLLLLVIAAARMRRAS